MDEPIIPVSMIQAKARADFMRGVGRDEHGMRADALALPTWLAEWDRCQTQALGALLAGGSPP